MPHTITNCIVLPEKFLLHLDNIINNNNKTVLIENICKTLIHEQLHILQREKYSIFKELYTTYWNFRLCNLNLKNNYLKNQRINPDGYDDWCYKEKEYDIYPFVSLKKKSFLLNDVKTLSIPIKNNSINYNNITNISNNKSYTNFFCHVSQNYHPNEISAIILSELITSKLKNTKQKKCPALDVMIPWINKYLI
jgi:hypothetical protein